MKCILIGIGFRPVLFYVACAVEVALVVPRAYAVVDQQNIPASAMGWSNIGSGNFIDWAQTFTVGITGTLVGVDVWVERDETVTLPLLFDIRRTIGGIPTQADAGNDVLASVTIPASAFSPLGNIFTPPAVLNHVDLTSSPVPVVAGEVLAIALRSDDPGIGGASYYWYSTDRLYPRGMAVGRIVVWGTESPFDQVFRTYVNPVPEPSTLIALGVASLFPLRRRL